MILRPVYLLLRMLHPHAKRKSLGLEGTPGIGKHLIHVAGGMAGRQNHRTAGIAGTIRAAHRERPFQTFHRNYL